MPRSPAHPAFATGAWHERLDCPRATEIRVLAERQMGEFLKGMPKATGAAGVGPIAVEHHDRNAATLKEIGITKDQSSRAQRLADIPLPAGV